jgi:hypothetical protein
MPLLIQHQFGGLNKFYNDKNRKGCHSAAFIVKRIITNTHHSTPKPHYIISKSKTIALYFDKAFCLLVGKVNVSIWSGWISVAKNIQLLLPPYLSKYQYHQKTLYSTSILACQRATILIYSGLAFAKSAAAISTFNTQIVPIGSGMVDSSFNLIY